MKIRVKFKSSNQYFRLPRASGQSRPSADTTSPDSRGLQSWNLHMASTFDTDEIIESGSKPQEEEGVPGVMHLSAAGQTPFPLSLESSSWHSLSWQRLIKITLIYLCTLPGITCEPKKSIFLEKKNRQTSPWHCDIGFLGNVQSSESCML